MRLLNKIIEKVTTTAKKAVLFGALVGGVGMMAYATETTVGPIIEKAQLEAVNISLDEVVAAITKVDPDWVNGLPNLVEAKADADAQGADWYIYDEVGDLDDPSSYTRLTGNLNQLCPDGTELCAIFVTVGSGTGTNPDYNALQDIQADIDQAISENEFDEEQIRMKP